MNKDNKFINSLIENAKAGNYSAFEQLYKLHVGRIYAVNIRLLANLRLAEEITSRVFTTVVEEIHFKRDDFSFSAWISGIAVHLSLNELRNNKQPDGDLEREALRVKSVLVNHADKLVITLPENLRLPMVLHFIEKYNLEETADILGLPAEEISQSIREAFSIVMSK